MIDQTQSYTLFALKWVAAFVLSFWLSVPLTVQTLVICMGLDFITGILAAFVKQNVASHHASIGIAKKVLILILTALAHVITDVLKLPFDLGVVVASAYIVNEIISITENCASAGVPVPPTLLDVLAKAKKLTGRNVKSEAVIEKLESVSVSRPDGLGGIESVVSSVRVTTGKTDKENIDL